jgi:hypothetical protein
MNLHHCQHLKNPVLKNFKNTLSVGVNVTLGKLNYQTAVHFTHTV